MDRECGEGCFDSRRRVNSTVLQLPLNAKRLDLPKGETDETVPYGSGYGNFCLLYYS